MKYLVFIAVVQFGDTNSVGNNFATNSSSNSFVTNSSINSLATNSSSNSFVTNSSSFATNSSTESMVASFETEFITLLQLSDIHYDPNYRIGAPTSCYIGDFFGSKCCRWYSVRKGPSSAMRWGDPNCDSPFALINSSISSASKHNVSYVLYTGDSPSHSDYTQIENTVEDAIVLVADLLKHYFVNTSVINALGNHDAWPVDNILSYDWDWLSDTIVKYWSTWLSPEQIKTLKRGGYYTKYLGSKLKIIVLETTWYDRYNYLQQIFGKDIKDPTDQYAWLKMELQDSKYKDEKVIITAHVPPESSEAGTFTNNFSDIIHNYSDIIICNIFGHVHFDAWSIMSNTIINFKSPSIVPNNMPRYRIFKFHNITYELIDIYTYWANITHANLNNNMDLEYTLLYTFKTAYNMDNLTVSGFNDLTARMNDNDTLRNIYNNYMYVS